MIGCRMSAIVPAILNWSWPARLVAFVLAATSIWCLLAEFYGLCDMRTFTLWILIPATVALVALAVADRVRGDGMLWRGVTIGAAAGFLAACAYDMFRLPFVVAAIDQTGPEWLRREVLPLLGSKEGIAHLSLAFLNHDDIGLATVYRVLTQFEAAGLIVKHNFEGGQSVYELDRGKHHDHMVDIESGKVIEFVSEEIERLQREIADKHGFLIEDHSLVLYVRPKRNLKK